MAHHETAPPTAVSEPATPRPWRDIRLERVPWDTAMLEDMRRIPLDSPVENASDLVALVDQGKACALKITTDGDYAGILIYSIETHHGVKELNFISLAAHAAAPISAHIARLLEDMATAADCQSIRFSTVHEGLARWAVKTCKFRISEIIMRKTI
jgi:hypothetical protein